MHAHTLKLHTGGQHAVVVHPVHRSPAAHARVYIIIIIVCIVVYGSPIHYVGFCCCCCLLLPLGLMMLHPRAYVFYYVPAYYYILYIILRRYSGSTSSSRRRVVAGGGGGGPVWCAVVLFTITTICICIYMCACVAWGLVGGPSELQRTSGGHRIKCALRNRSLCLLQQQHGGKVRACPARLPACCSCGSRRAAAGRHVFRPVHL